MNWSVAGVGDEYFACESHLKLGLSNIEDHIYMRGGSGNWLVENAENQDSKFEFTPDNKRNIEIIEKWCASR